MVLENMWIDHNTWYNMDTFHYACQLDLKQKMHDELMTWSFHPDGPRGKEAIQALQQAQSCWHKAQTHDTQQQVGVLCQVSDHQRQVKS